MATTTTTSSDSSIITELQGDLFSDAPEGAVLIHACNCQGSWGSGIAEVFKRRYPAAYLIYHAHCHSHLSTPQTRPVNPTTTTTASKIQQPQPQPQPRTLKLPEGTALLIPPQPADYHRQPVTVPAPPRGRGRGTTTTTTTTTVLRGAGKKHWIVCLFTSFNYGRQRSAAGVILENTRLAVGDLKGQIERMKMEGDGGEGEEEMGMGMGMGELWGCRFNAGLFGVPWEATRGVLEEVGVGMRIVRPVGE
ncbi:ADP-ribose 1''-phosphate phosphatase [Onygenales sp. PD_10]|nr:ADP-ribose 1''-phosphate phosphatase [Onygenales sp. PD_10]